jgi:hypothetical protein
MGNICRSTRLSFFVLLVVCLSVNAQVIPPSSEPKIIPPSPNASAFAKYGNIPVSTYTGVPNISLPIYEIRVRDITVPISLSYHASGIKVGDEASRVGLGWVLNAGGVISRNIINRDDLQELPDAFLSTMNSAPAIPQGPNFPPASLVQGGQLYGNSKWVDLGPLIYKYYSTQSPQSGIPTELDITQYLQVTGIDPLFKPNDFEPDQFTYNFQGYSGKFVLNKSRDVILEKQEKIRIRINPLSTNGPTWEITTPDGFIYKFLDFEYIRDDNTLGYLQRTAWYLTEIISPQNEHVTFYYTAPEQQYIIPVGSFYERWAPNLLSCSGQVCRTQPNYRHPVVGKNYSNISLDRIEWSNGKIKFNVAKDRLDIEGDKRITSIQIFKKDAVEPYEEIAFLHDYFTSSSSGPTYEFPTNNPDKALKRLKLSGISRRALPISNKQVQQHSFSYYDESFPPKNSFARDHWGYYNGKNGNTSLIPKYTDVVTGTPTLSDITGIMGAEREPSSVYAQGLALKSITYPTKGTTTFFYSSNDFEYSPSNIGGASQEPESYPTTNSFLYNASNKGVVQALLFDLTDEYVSRDGHFVPVTVNGAFRTSLPVSCDLVTGAPDAYFELVSEAGLSFGVITANGQRCTPPGDIDCPQKKNLDCVSCCSGSMVFEINKRFVLRPGKYYWKAYMGSSETQIVDISAQCTWIVDAHKRPQLTTELDGSVRNYRIGGGIRINKIEDYDPSNNQKANVRKYDYHYTTDIDNNGVKEIHSYGKRMVQPKYSYYDVSIEATNIIGDYRDICLNCITLIRDSGHPNANHNSTPVAYDKVMEYLGENGENGYTEYEYENDENEEKEYLYPYTTQPISSNITIDKLPILPPFSPTIQNPRNGNLKKQTNYSATGTKLMMTENTYQLRYNNVMYGLGVREISVDQVINIYGKSFVLMLPYETVSSYFSYLSETIITKYLPTGMEANKVRTQFFYDNPDHLQLTKRIDEKSNLHKIITSYKYPSDYTDIEASTAILNMKGNKFMHSLPIETTILDESPEGIQRIKHREFIVYDNFNAFTFPKEKVVLQSTSLLLPSDAPSYIPSGLYNQQLYKKSYTLDYNSFGNLKKIQKPSDIPTGYLWGYGETLPIAEIKNGTAEESFFTSFEEDGALLTDVFGLNLARTGIKVNASPTFTFPVEYTPIESNTLMSYWYWQNGKWNFSSIIPFQRSIVTTGTHIDEVRAFSKSTQMTTFTHLPFVGISSQTDANNITLYYEYDEMSRLKLIRDSNKKILKSYEYAYKK